MTDNRTLDPKGLINDAFLIDGIQAPECRSIFLDWALSLGPGIDPKQAAQELIALHAQSQPPQHPMFVVLNDAVKAEQRPKRRGGRMGRGIN